MCVIINEARYKHVESLTNMLSQIHFSLLIWREQLLQEKSLQNGVEKCICVAYVYLNYYIGISTCVYYKVIKCCNT